MCAVLIAGVLCGSPNATAYSGDFAGSVGIGNGRAMFVECRGTGSPTVVLMAGKGNGADDWLQILEPGDPEHDAPGDDLPFGFGNLIHSDAAVLPSVAHFNRVCAYDRPDVLPESARQGEQVTFADWLAAQDQLAAARGAEHVGATHSGHDIYLYSPALVVSAIRDVVAQVTRIHG